MAIHPTAVVSAEAQLGSGVEIGPWCVISGPVVLGDGVRLRERVSIAGRSRIGAGTEVWPGACLGFEPQDAKFDRAKGSPGIEVGPGSKLRENVTIHAASSGKEVPTRVGARCFMMAGAHVGHDVQVGDDVTLVNATVLGGHSIVGDRAIISGLCAVHQHTRVGRLSMMSGGSEVSTDVPPFCVAWGRNALSGVNLVGMRRAGIPRDQITEVRRAFDDLLRKWAGRQETVAELERRGASCPPLLEMARFISESKRSLCVYRRAMLPRDDGTIAEEAGI
ncbi:MAG: acyl-[acyl-carrier-protein]--UDP-N-acetylglucosamine O-acyltransferase [Planctomyces sp.]|nr:acyl-[acyl-carrier-protein]--UDP-N-acetylglucosamine O-acyltransferase [Planctomyces sp.]MBA4119591.1 acyl-[acyl-carrier-protein]--UDP-N-acetylglucosamine O-acyltransferase [Isosphaera sp.]